MSPVAVHIDESESPSRFRAVAGTRESVGRTAGEALDRLLQQEGPHIESSAILIQRFAPDAYFTQAQCDRLQDLLSRRDALTPEENTELDHLIDAELEATVARTDALVDRLRP